LTRRMAGRLAAMVLALGAGAAHAQAPAGTCEAVKRLLVVDKSQTEALRGAQIETTDDGIVYAANVSLPGFSGCTLTISRDAEPYRDHDLDCEGELASETAAIRYIEDVWSCTRDMFYKRSVGEYWLDGRYHMVEVEGEFGARGRDEEASFGDDEYAWMWLERMYSDSGEIAFRIFYSYLD
jgi:hypothetical protein